MEKTGTLFGWAFGDPSRNDDAAYMAGLEKEALNNATAAAKSKGVTVVAGSEAFTALSAEDSLVELDHAPDKLVVRCTVQVEGPGAAELHAEGPMNG